MKFDNGIEITNLRNVQRMPDESFLLDVDILAPGSPVETVVYCARGSDIAVTGQWVYQQIIEGHIQGEITNWVPFPPPSNEEVGNRVLKVRNFKLCTEVDPVVSNPLRWADMTEAQRQEWINYRLALLDLTNDPNFPYYNMVVTIDPAWGAQVNINNFPWPTKPI
jgi:hypothetical protein